MWAMIAGNVLEAEEVERLGWRLVRAFLHAAAWTARTDPSPLWGLDVGLESIEAEVSGACTIKFQSSEPAEDRHTDLVRLVYLSHAGAASSRRD